MNRPAAAADNGRLEPIVWKILIVVSLGPLITQLDSTVVNVALSTLSRELTAPLTLVQWVISGYLLALVLMLPLSGWLIDRFGAKQLYIGIFAQFTFASVLCGLSTSIHALIGARVLQGVAGGLLAPMAQTMVARAAPGRIARVVGFMAVPVLMGPILGPTLAGLILQRASWHWLFFINLPIGVIAIALAAWILPVDAPSVKQRGFDLAGFLMISPGLVLFLYSLGGLAEDPAASLRYALELLVALALLALFVRHAIRRGSAALVDLQLFRDASFSASALTQFCSNGISIGGQMLLPLYMLTILQFSPAKAGFLLASSGLGALMTYPCMGFLTERFGSRRVSTSGALIGLVGLLPLALLPPSALSTWLISGSLFVRGIGMSSITIPSIAAAYTGFPKETIPVATTAINIVQRLGGPGATTVLAIFLHTLSAPSWHRGTAPALLGDAAAFTATLWLLCAFQVVTIVAALRLPLRPRRQSA